MTDAPSLSDPDVLHSHMTRFQAASDPALHTARLTEVIRVVPRKRTILRGMFGDRAAVFRIFDDPGSAAPAREWAEMTRIWPHMDQPHLRSVEPLYHAPAYGVIVVEDVPGTALMEHIYALDPTQRPGLMTAPAKWLRAYTAPTQTRARAKAAAWYDRAEAAHATQPHAKLQRRERKLLRQLKRLRNAASEDSWRFAICHGDFHPNNLIYAPPRLTGIDLGGSSSMPIYKDMARFLMHMGRRGLHPSGKSAFGVDLEALEAFSTQFDLSAWERSCVLPFMLGVEALIRVEGPSMSRSRIRRAAQMYDLLIADLEQI